MDDGRVQCQSYVLTLSAYHIPLSVDPGVFTMTDKQKSREALNLPQDKIIFTFLSDRLDNKRKGLEILLQSINLLPEEDKSKVLIVNIGQGDYHLPSVVNVGRISDQKKIAQILSASDALMLPSREDNFPNVMLEANACGCPVIAFPVGGIREFIKEGFNGLMAKEVSAKSFKEILQTFVREKPSFDRAQIREHVVTTYSPARQAESYISFIKKLLSNNSSYLLYKTKTRILLSAISAFFLSVMIRIDLSLVRKQM
ncbi:glycosyltransferase [Chitinophaga pinensis]|uniref:Glycosyltransferase n=2 Tax=Chitinophaga pinensis TaxID=79329 RepID=A0A5C6LYZ9_9BACT|nr:glycosyltransferase [Chitinophaga pinensis]